MIQIYNPLPIGSGNAANSVYKPTIRDCSEEFVTGVGGLLERIPKRCQNLC